jgi:glycosyltransferase involved in cell wall biosynthesis
MFEGSGLSALKDAPSNPMRRFILFLSRFDREKGGRELLQAFAALMNEFPDTDLVMAGDGEDMRLMRHSAQQLNLSHRVVFTGYIGGAEKWRLLRDCTLFALPTYFRGEGMPVAILEAMGAGKPLLVSSAGSIRTIVSEPENGLVLEGVTPEAVQNGLRRLLSDTQFAERAGKHNADIAWKKFEANVVTAELEDIYQQVAKC